MFEGDSYFSVVPITGQVQVAVASIDREYRDQYIMGIRALDQGPRSHWISQCCHQHSGQ